jgi:hypothetical protein
MSLLVDVTKRRPTDAGYFRLGTVILSIPPEEITTNKVINNEELTPLRSQYAMYRKTGHSRWDVTIRWTAFVDYAEMADTPSYAQYLDLQRVLAMFMASPFVEVENAYLRQLLVQEDPTYAQGSRMAFGLRQLRIDTLPDMTDALGVTLTMTLFNYAPFSLRFGYQGNNPLGVSANQSPAFRDYLDRWIVNNLDNPRARRDFPGLLGWKQQATGTTTFHWRNYQAVPNQRQAPPVETGTATTMAPATGKTYTSASQPQVRGRHSVMQPVNPPAAIKQIIIDAATRNGIDPNLALAVAQRESSFNPRIQNPKSTATGLFQLTNATAHDLGVTDSTDAIQNANGGCKYIAQMLNRYHGDTVAALTAFAAGPGNVDKYGAQGTWAITKPPHAVDLTWIPGWLADITNIYQRLSAVAAQTPPPLPASDLVTKTAFQQVADDAQNTVRANDETVAQLISEGWLLDHHTDAKSFLFQTQSLTLVSAEDSGGDSDPGLYPTQVSIQFVNNLAQIPLAAYAYPTYQHIGPAGTMISIAMMSNGAQVDDEEPQHEELAQLTGMVSTLEHQFVAFRGDWKSVQSIHRMQAVVIENPVLNLLGIYGVMPQSMTTTTLAESATMTQVAFTCSRYENVFEQLHPYLVKGTAEYDKVWKKEVFDGTYIDKFAQDDVRIEPLNAFVSARRTRNVYTLYEFLINNPTALSVPMSVPIAPADAKTLRSAIASITESNSAVGARVAGDSALNFNDYILCTQSSWGIVSADILAVKRVYDQRIDDAIRQGSFDPYDALFDVYLDWLKQTDRGLASAISILAATPDLQQKLAKAVDANGPGAQDWNLEHVAYKDLGLSNLNDRPSGYFVDDANQFHQKMMDFTDQTAKTILDTSDYFNKVVATTAINVSPSDSTFIATAKINGGSQQENEQEKQDRVKSIVENTVIPYNSMDRAFPTFKLFLAEEDNTGAFYMFDDFYTYASVLSFEIIRYQDRPDTAVFQLMNLSNLLSHKLYDQSVEGKFEFDNSYLKQVRSASNGEALAGFGGGKISATESVTGFQQPVDLTAGFDNSRKKVNLQYYALQTGSKIQIRMGYSNNPDELWPVFSGIVTSLEGDDILEIVAQGFAVELVAAAPDDLSYNGFYPTQVLSNVTSKLLATASNIFHPIDAAGLFVRGLGRGPAYGGYALMGEAGNTTGVIAAMLKVSSAVHFGAWQVGVPVEGILKGYGYGQLAGAALGLAGLTHLPSLLESGYDRSDENIYVNHFYGANGRSNASRLQRDFQLEMPLNAIPASYYVPKDPSITPWRIIQDVKRRYPEYIVAVKPYGFPYGIDATLVFANPNDYYLARPRLTTEAEIGTFTKADSNPFLRWWHTTGWREFQALGDATDWNWAAAVWYKLTGTKSPFESVNIKNLMTKIETAGDRAAETFSDIMKLAIEIAINAQKVPTILPEQRYKEETRNLQKEMTRLLEQAQIYVQRERNASLGLSNQPRPNDRLQPVRKWISIGKQNIIHNGIQLNGNIYNAVRVDDETQACNSGSKTVRGHLNILDVDRLIIDPVNNVRQPKLQPQYKASFLRDEVGKMYRGELVLAGVPEINPYDILLINDPVMNMVGPIEVDSVIHSFDREMGFLTIVKPRAVVMINEAFTAGALAGLHDFFSNFTDELGDLIHSFLALPNTDKGILAGGAVTAAVGTGIGLTALGGQAVSVAGSVAGVLGLGAGATISLPVTATAAVIGTIAVAASLSIMVSARQGMTPLLLAPLNRYDQPWVAGVEGWALNDLHTSFLKKWQVFKTYDLEPTLQGIRDLSHAVSEPGSHSVLDYVLDGLSGK